MRTERVTPCEAGSIFHRAGTELQEARGYCENGHMVPRYTNSGHCVACAKLAMYRHRGTNARPSNRMRHYLVYEEARADHEYRGGWLLVLDRGRYGVTDKLSTIQRYRGMKWLRRCDALECWDEVELAEHRPRLVAAAGQGRTA